MLRRNSVAIPRKSHGGNDAVSGVATPWYLYLDECLLSSTHKVSSGTSFSGSSHPMAVKHVSLSFLTPREMLAFSLASQVQLLLPSQLSEVCVSWRRRRIHGISSFLLSKMRELHYMILNALLDQLCSPVRMPVEAGLPCRSHL